MGTEEGVSGRLGAIINKDRTGVIFQIARLQHMRDAFRNVPKIRQDKLKN